MATKGQGGLTKRKGAALCLLRSEAKLKPNGRFLVLVLAPRRQEAGGRNNQYIFLLVLESSKRRASLNPELFFTHQLFLSSAGGING